MKSYKFIVFLSLLVFIFSQKSRFLNAMIKYKTKFFSERVLDDYTSSSSDEVPSTTNEETAEILMPKSKDSGLSGGAIAAIVIVCCVVVIAVIVAVIVAKTGAASGGSAASYQGANNISSFSNKVGAETGQGQQVFA